MKMEDLLKELDILIDAKIRTTWESDGEDHLSALSASLQSICEKILHIGSRADESYDDDRDVDRYSAAIVHYDWMKEAKSYLTLWRDVIFENQKSLIMQRAGHLEGHQLEELKRNSRNIIEEASLYLKETFDKLVSRHSPKERYISDISLRTNPWSVYKDQINRLESQSHKLLDQYEKLVKTDEQLEQLKTSLNELIDSYRIEISRIQHLGDQSVQEVETHLSAAPWKLVKLLDDLDHQSLAAHLYNAYTFMVDQICSEMVEEVEVPIRLVHGQPEFKLINFREATRSWLDSEVQPQIIELQELIDTIGNSMKMTLVNIRNRLSIIANEQQEAVTISKDELIRPIKSANDIIEGRLERLAVYETSLKEKLEEHLHISDIYDTQEEFLAIPQQYLVGQVRTEEAPLFKSVKNWFFSKTSLLKGFLDDVAEEESLTQAEKVVRYVKGRSLPRDNHQYSNIFSASGFIGESFWVGRESQLNHISKLIQDWRQGYRGSAIISGKRFTGRTAFGEIVATRFFPNRTIRLRPHLTLKINGRTFDAEDDLAPALEFVKKNTINDPHLVWIDDLELWHSSHKSISQNIQSLLRYIDELSGQLFFMVSMTNWFKAHYDQMTDLDRVFQAIIDLDYMPEEEVRQAITIRHGATHKLLVDEEGEEVIQLRFAKMVQHVYRSADYNIGQALNLWSYSIFRVNDQRVIYKPIPSHQLPDFIKDDNAILLRTLLMTKRTNEYGFRKMLGSSFAQKYRPIVQRLLRLGVLERHVDGMLEVNESIVNDIAYLLDQADYITYDKS